jgi:hypothetical protein
VTAPFRDGQSLAWERYPACGDPGDMAWLVVSRAEVHQRLDALLARAPEAMAPSAFMVWYERVMDEPNTRIMLEILATCGIFIAG